MFEQAKWIWRHQCEEQPYNQAILARRAFRVHSVQRAELCITADSWYRVYVNGLWINDGPCRSWPEHYQYDVLDLAPYLLPGENEIAVVARYFGIGTFHQVPQRPGLLAQLDITDQKGRATTVVTDRRWDVSELPGWVRNTPKICIQMESFEEYDARYDTHLDFDAAEVVCGAEGGPWQDLNPRDCPLLTREPVHFTRFVAANVVDRRWMAYVFPTMRLLYPGLIEANHTLSLASAVATVVHSDKARTVRIEGFGHSITINGQGPENGAFALRKGDNFLFAPVTQYFGHAQKDTWIRFHDSDGLRLVNPLRPKHANPWCFAPMPDGEFIADDMIWMTYSWAELEAYRARMDECLHTLVVTVHDAQTFKKALGKHIRVLPVAEMLMDDAHGQFTCRNVLEDRKVQVECPTGLMYDNAAGTVAHPSKSGDVELVYDLGVQRCGYWDFDIIADDGVMVDIFAVEYINPDGKVQHTGDARNGMRFVCKQGLNRYTSVKRRSGRFLYITLRNQRGPVQIRHFRVIESMYPVDAQGSFSSSDPAWDRIWEISARTLNLCMEDTYTDCPLYEQTLWVGDARNEAVFGFTAFGAADLARRCITLAGQSLERYPIIGCQVPSGWDCILPAWSFLWGISVWDYYFYTGDKAFLKKVWPWVKKNLSGAAKLMDERGLFSAPFWNLFDWAGIDDGHRTVLHNSMFLVGAIDAARDCAEALGDRAEAKRLTAWRATLVTAINATWDAKSGAYPDSIPDEQREGERPREPRGIEREGERPREPHGEADQAREGERPREPRTCQHTHFLSLLYNIVPDDLRAQALSHALNPPEGMTRVGSPFAIMYLYEALDKLGRYDAILESIRACYQPMLDAGATTVWETFSNSNISNADFPTRSHCHAWSSAPVHFLNRIVLGIQQTGIGGHAYTISPWVEGLTQASGASVSINGPIRVAWRKEGEKLTVTASAPKGVALRFVPNASHEGLEIGFVQE